MAEPPDADVKRVYNYLQQAAAKSRGTDIRPFTVPAIVNETSLTPSEVTAALNAKDSETQEHLVYVKIHLPTTTNGDRVWRRLAKAGFVSRSAFATMFLVLLVGWVLVNNLPRDRITEAHPGEAEVYLKGAADAIFGMGTAGLILASVLRNYGSRHLQWKAVNSATHDRVWSATKAALGAGTLCAVASLAVYWWIGKPMQWGSTAAWFAVGFPIGITYWALFKRNEPVH
jgi:hypothetical protein